MRPKTAHRVVYNSIEKLLYNGIMYDKKLMLRAIDKLLSKALNQNKKWNKLGEYYDHPYPEKEQEINLVGGYGVTKNNLGQLFYISDRFNCDFRLYWLKLMVEQDMFDGTITWRDYE